jgi:hypothetical protein
MTGIFLSATTVALLGSSRNGRVAISSGDSPSILSQLLDSMLDGVEQCILWLFHVRNRAPEVLVPMI